MTDRVEPAPEPVAPPTTRSTANQVAAWAGVAAAVVFIVAVVFFSGFVIGRSTDGGGFHSRYQPTPGPGMMMPGQMMPGQRGPEPVQPPTTSPRP